MFSDWKSSAQGACSGSSWRAPWLAVGGRWRAKWNDAQWRGSRRGRSGCGNGRLAKCRCSDGEFTLIERRQYRIKNTPKAAQRFASVLRHKEWARQKVVTTVEADAKSSDHLLTRSHEGRDQSTAGDPSSSLSLSSQPRPLWPCDCFQQYVVFLMASSVNHSNNTSIKTDHVDKLITHCVPVRS